ncbi:MAG: LysR family transcriptional regulator [Rhodobacterales bacterium]|nr:LysR family transcriptional regulator [Rhodobacterales bacterium]
MQSFDIVTLRVFLSVARAGSIGAAARREHIAASAASRRISDLEHDLGAALIKRTPSGATLTPAGRVFAEHCETILGQYADVRADLKRFSEGEAGELRIAAVTSAMNGALPFQVADFRRRHPAVDARLSEVFSNDALRYLREDLADLVVVSDTEDTRGFQVAPYATDPIWVLGSAGHPLFRGRAEGEPIPFAETLDHEHLSLHLGGVLDELVVEGARRAGRTPLRRVEVMRFDALRRCAEAGLGLGFLRASSVRPFTDKGTLRGHPLADDWADRRLVCVYPKGQDASPVMNLFLDLIQETAEG